MLSIAPAAQVILVAGVTDMRKGFNCLSAIVQNDIKKDPLSARHLYVFCNRNRNRIKILFWECGGLWLCSKRLERGTFAWPTMGTPYIEMAPEELMLLLGGIDASTLHRRPWYQAAQH